MEFLTVGPNDARADLLLAHGAGAAMTSPFMDAIAALLGERGIRVHRFEFAYMAARRQDGKRRPPPKAEKMTGEFMAAIDAARTLVGVGKRLLIGGKSMGGRIASLVANDARERRLAQGLVCLGYPFHPPGKPDSLRTDHLFQLRCPALIVQGERDPFGSRSEVEKYGLPESISIAWASDGDHDLGSRGGNLSAAADAIAAFADRTIAAGGGPAPPARALRT